MKFEIPYTEEEKEALRHCELCPRKCGVNRLEGEKGFCNCGCGLEIAMVCNHKGEEPILSGEKGICNVFFSHCNLQCVYCQNKQISSNKVSVFHPFKTFDELIEKIKTTLLQSENVLGFVSPSHHQMLMKAIIRRLHEEGFYPKTIYNTNAYDNPSALRKLEGIIDIYLPDYKYTDPDLAKQLSKAEDYPHQALDAIKEMYRQKGSSLLTDSENRIESGLIVRHLVLPSKKENSKRVLDNLCDISFNLNISLMSQYAPLEPLDFDFLNSRLTQDEYDEVCDYFFSIGLHKGFFQELSSQDNLVPDFEKGTWS